MRKRCHAFRTANLPSQEHSIKARQHELYAKPHDGTSKPVKPFPVYLRETPAEPLAPITKVVLWTAAIIVGMLFLAAIWRASHRHNAQPTTAQPSANTTLMPRRLDRVTIVKRDGKTQSRPGVHSMPTSIQSVPERAAPKFGPLLWQGPFDRVKSGTVRVLLRLIWRIVLLGLLGLVTYGAVLILYRSAALGV